MNGSLLSSIERARRGDRAAFDEIVLAFHAPLIRFTGMVLGGDVHTAHDVVQESFVALLAALPTLSEPRYVQAWLYRVAYRRAVSWARRKGPGGRPFCDYSPEGDELVVPPSGAPGRTWNVGGAWVPSEDVTPRLRAALRSLPALYAAPLTLYYLESLDLEETALLLGLPVSTLKMRLQRGRKLLRTRVLSKEPWLPLKTRARRPKVPPSPALLAAETAPPLGPPLSPGHAADASPHGSPQHDAPQHGSPQQGPPSGCAPSPRPGRGDPRRAPDAGPRGLGATPPGDALPDVAVPPAAQDSPVIERALP